jgi:hypothetical protein
MEQVGMAAEVVVEVKGQMETQAQRVQQTLVAVVAEVPMRDPGVLQAVLEL